MVQLREIKEFSTVSQMVEFSTMISTTTKENNKTSFVRVKSVDKNYPLYGKVVLEPENALDQLIENINSFYSGSPKNLV